MKNLLNISGGDNPERVADVIFVHGLDGDARTTWMPKERPDKFWPAWLGEDLPDVGIWTLGYAVNASAWKGTTMPLIDRATNVLDLFELDDIGHRPVSFVCHSLGGLLVKQALRLAAESKNSAWRAIADHAALIVFLSTPHSGADIASWIQYLGKLLRTTVTVEELEAHHPRLRELNDWYRDHVEDLGIKTFVYCEKVPTAGVLVVNETTANPGLRGVRPIPVDEDHVSICKPASRDAQIYRRVKRLIEDTLLNRDLSASTVMQTKDDNHHRAQTTDRASEQNPQFSPFVSPSPVPDATGPHPTAQTKEPRWQHYYETCLARWSDPRYALDTRFVQLTLLVDQGEDAQGARWQASSEQYQDLRDVLARVPEPAIVLLGPPGSGKSTLLRNFEMDCARAVLNGDGSRAFAAAPLTFFIQLNDFKAKNPDDPIPSPKDWLAERWAAQWPQLPTLDELLRGARLTLLLDALNEIPYPGPEPVQRWKEFLRHLVQDYPGAQVIFTCRSLDYSASLSSKDLTVPQVRIEALSDEQIRDFLEVYCPTFRETLWENLKDSPQRDVLRSPYYLKLLIQQTVAGEIPAGRAALFTGFVRQALRREVLGDSHLFREGEQALLHARDRQRLMQAGAWNTPFALPERGSLIPKLSRLAFQMQTRRSGSEGGQVRIDYDEAVDMLDDPCVDDLLKAGGALGVVEQDLGRDEVLFVHQLLQEYFAARQLAREPHPEFVAQEWRVERVTPSLADTIATLAGSDPLPPLPRSGWEETTVLASAMAVEPDRFVTEIMAQQLPLAARCAVQEETEVAEQLKDSLRVALVARTQDAQADLRARIEAGLALGDLGDPRFGRHEGPDGPYVLPPMVEIRGGRYTISSDAGQDEGPAHEVDLESFWMGQFPVTNAEWALFLKAGGYEEERWWETEEAKAWRRGENTAEGPKENWRYWRSQFQADVELIHRLLKEGRMIAEVADRWKEFVTMPDDEFEKVLDRQWPGGRHTQPMYWTDANFNNAQQPVVGICWNEARAYCAWLGAQTGMTFRLPSEAEWEAAARGFAARRYAYGEDFDPFRCNVLETHIRRTTPVGVFPGGNTPEGLMDMTGNVWEWTSSLYQPYPYRSDDGREDDGREDDMSGTAGRRVLRGGSCYFNQYGTHATYRSSLHPGSRNDFIGFRVVRSSPISS